MARNIIKKYTRPPKEIIHNYTVIQNPKKTLAFISCIFLHSRHNWRSWTW